MPGGAGSGRMVPDPPRRGALGGRDVESFRTSYREPGVVVPEEELLLPEMPEPRHGKVRRIVNAVVGWHKTVRVEQFVRDLSNEYLDPIVERGHGELVASTRRRSRST